MTVMELRTPEEWSKRYGVIIMDPDGWRGKDDPSWETPIDRNDFIRRMSMSTIRSIRSSEVKNLNFYA